MSRDLDRGLAGGVLWEPIAGLYAGVTALRGVAYQSGLLRSVRIGAKVISIGNLVAGGAGKTPLAIAVAERLRAAGQRVAVLTRGYRGGSERGVGIIEPGQGGLADPRRFGDEAVLIAKRLRDVPVLCGADRAVLGQRAIEAFGSETLILDDGFQHRHLARDVDLVVLRAPRPFGNGRLLPRGPLREAVGALRRCDGIIVNTSDGPLAEPLPEWLADAVPVAEARARPTALIQLRQDEAQSLDRLRGRRVLVVAGVARPSSVVRTVEALDARVIELVARPDHHPWTEAEVETLGRRAAQADAVLLTTEKDAVKWTAPPVGSVALKIEAEVIGGGEALWRLVLGASSRATESLACSRSG